MQESAEILNPRERDALLGAVTDHVFQAGDIALRHYSRSVQIEEKPDASVVTQADRDVEDFLRETLRPLLPDAAWIGEESARGPGSIVAARRAEWVWVVDPIDGTAGFTDGIDTFCISVGLLYRGRPWLGVVYTPVTRHTWQTAAGAGVRYDGRAVHALTSQPIPDRRVLYVDARSHLKYRIRWRGKTRSLGSTAVHNALVARGAAVGALSTAHIWDYAGAAALLQEAGALIRHLDGTEIKWTNWFDGRHLHPPVLAAPPLLWQELAAEIEILPDAPLQS